MKTNLAKNDFSLPVISLYTFSYIPKYLIEEKGQKIISWNLRGEKKNQI